MCVLLAGVQVIPLELWPIRAPCPPPAPPLARFGNGKHLPYSFVEIRIYVSLHVFVVNCSKYENEILLDCGNERLYVFSECFWFFYCTPFFCLCILNVQEKNSN